MKSKKDLFIETLKLHGVTEYWCDSFFNIDSDNPYGEVLLPSKDLKLGDEVAYLYNDYDKDEERLMVWQAEKGSDLFKVLSEGKERRLV